MAKIFISKSISTDENWVKILQDEGHSITGLSCIETQTVLINEVPAADWTFFSSAQGVIHFLAQHPIISHNIGVMGLGTKKALMGQGYAPQFIGQSSDPFEVGQNFALQLKKNQTILFPESSISKRSIASQLQGHKIIHLPCYQTKPIAINITPQDIYIFTSPSNVDGFLMNQSMPEAHIIAYGPTTAKYLLEKGAKQLTALEKVSSNDLLRAIKEKFSG